MPVLWSGFVLLVAASYHGADAKLPSYIHVCKRNDPMIDQCILQSVETLKPYLLKGFEDGAIASKALAGDIALPAMTVSTASAIVIYPSGLKRRISLTGFKKEEFPFVSFGHEIHVVGIPELDVPSLEPVRFPEVVIAKTSSFRAVGTDVVISGASNYTVTSFKSDIPKLTFYIGLHFPYIQVDANYDVNMRILALVLKGNGPLQSNNTDIDANAILKGHKEVRNGKTYAKFDTLELKLKWKNYNVKLENLFNGDRRLGDAVNAALNQNKKEMLDAILPTLEKIVSNTLLEIADKITKNFTFEELFPEN